MVAPGTVFTLVDDDEVRAGLVAEMPGWPATATALLLGSAPTPVDPLDLVRFGADLHRLRVALAAQGVGVDPAAAAAGQHRQRRARPLTPSHQAARPATAGSGVEHGPAERGQRVQHACCGPGG